jgi:predicted small lipoprotein YifL
MRFATILLFLCTLQGCGQKGPLAMPTPQPQESEAQQPDMQNPGASSSQQSQ